MPRLFVFTVVRKIFEFSAIKLFVHIYIYIYNLRLKIHILFFVHRDASLGEVRASSGDLTRLVSNNESLDPLGGQDREKDLNWKPLPNNGPRFQSGVLRTNCIDCLDRTNVAQYAYGLAALGRQLHAMSLTDIPKLNQESSIATALMEMYLSMGDALAQQYGGSAAHNTVRSFT